MSVQTQQVSSMTVEELKALIGEIIDQRLEEGAGFEHLRALIAEEIELQLGSYLQEPDPDKAREAIRWLSEHAIEPAPGSPSVVEIIRKGRDR